MAATSTKSIASHRASAPEPRVPRGSPAPVPSFGYHPLLTVVAAMTVGIVVDRYASLPFALCWAVAVIGGIGWWYIYRQGREGAAAIVLLLAVAVTGAAWHHLRWNLFTAADLGLYAAGEGKPLCVEAVALGTPRRVPAPPFDPLRALPAIDRSRLPLKIVSLRDGRAWRPAAGRTQLTVDGHLLGIRSGDRVRIFAELAAPQPAGNPGEFDYAGYIRGRRTLCSLRATHPDCVEVIDPARGFSVRGAIDGVRTTAGDRLWRNLSYHESGLAAAILLGMREQLAGDVTTAFFQTGTIHLLAISGLHVGILAAALFGVFRLGLVPRRTSLALVAILVVTYAMVTDARPSVVRAAIMVVIVCGSLWLRRPALRWNSLAAAAVVVLALNPTELFHVGAQLSFLAAAVLVWFGGAMAARGDEDPLKRLIRHSRPWPQKALRFVGARFAQIAVASTLIWIIAAPLIMARFHLVSPVAPLLNVFLWIPVAVALVSGFAIMTVGWLLPPLAGPLSAFCETSLVALEQVVGTAASFTSSHVWVAGPADWWLAGFYGLLALWVACPGWRPPPRWCVAILAAWITIGFAPALVPDYDTELRVTVLDVGHGSSVVLELPDGRTLLYDAGRLGSSERGADSISAYLWSRGITHLDGVVISHADLDHYNALPELLDRFSVGVVYVSPMMFENEGRALDAVRSAIDSAGIPLREIHAPQRLEAGEEVSIEVMHPTRIGVLGRDNANSIVLAIEYRGRRILLPGDLESPGLDMLLAESPYDCDVLMAPHHGSPRSDPTGLSRWCDPEWVLVSGQQSDDARRVAQSYTARGSRVLHTSDRGAITVRISADRLEVEGFRSRGR